MIITRTPLRISIGGGGTDLPSFYEREGGFVISAAISKYIYIGINPIFVDDYVLKYSELERVASVDDIAHPLIREALRMHEIEPGVEIMSLADIPAGTGLGSSASFTVGLLRALYAYQRDHVTQWTLAEEASRIEIELLDEPVGKQDQYIASFGGLTCFEFAPDGSVAVSPLRISNETLHDLEENLLMFFTGYARSAVTVLEDQRVRSQAGDTEMLDNLRFIKNTGREIAKVLEAGEVEQFAGLMHEHWMRKRERSGSMTNETIDGWYDFAMRNGALGGKLVGAGNGGFLLFYARDRDALRRALVEAGLTEVRFTFDHDGSVVSVRA
ncbi:MAG TPA: galactokinase [Acidimicrobiia bacterium]|jgi:D-glycero-alpha-D-manno-heptose-7-phosphate kinase